MPENRLFPGPNPMTPLAMLPASPAPSFNAPEPMQQPQPVANLLAQPQPMLAQPSQYFSPYAGISGGRDSVLSQDPRQERLGAAFDGLLQSAVQGPNRKAEREMQATNIFGNAIGGLMALVGGPGTASGGAALIRDTNAKVQEMKAERRRQQQDALAGLRTLTDIVNTTSPYSQKNLASALKGSQSQTKLEQGAAKLEIDKENAITRRFRAVNANEIAARKATETERHNKAAEQIRKTLGEAGIKFDYDKLNTSITMANAKNAIWQQIAALQDATKNRALDVQEQTQLQNLKAKYQMFNARQLQSAQQFDLSMQALGARHNNKGELILGGATIPSLTAMGVGVDADIEAFDDPDPIAKAEQLISQPIAPVSQPPMGQVSQVPAEAPGQAPKAIPPQVLQVFSAQIKANPAAANKLKLQLIDTAMRRGGMSFEEASAAVSKL